MHCPSPRQRKIKKLMEEIEANECQIANTEGRLAGLERSLVEATDDAKRWRGIRDYISECAGRAAEVLDGV